MRTTGRYKEKKRPIQQARYSFSLNEVKVKSRNPAKIGNAVRTNIYRIM